MFPLEEKRVWVYKTLVKLFDEKGEPVPVDTRVTQIEQSDKFVTSDGKTIIIPWKGRRSKIQRVIS